MKPAKTKGKCIAVLSLVEVQVGDRLPLFASLVRPYNLSNRVRLMNVVLEDRTGVYLMGC